jgi:tetratricopeptide (TPR) repeat protein
MRLHVLALVLLGGGASWVGAADKGADLFRAGESRLTSGDLQGALQQFGQAVRADQSNQQYVQQYAMLRQVLMMRDSLPKEKDLAQWEHKARALHSFYLSKGLYGEAVKIDQQLHAKVNTGATALLLAETQVAMNRPAEAARVLADLAPEKHTLATRSLHGLALARQGNTEEAKKIAQSIQVADSDGPGAVYAAARLYAALGDNEQACRLLVRCFESAAPSSLEGFKRHAQASPEFAGLAGDTKFTAALQTASKVPESACSGGSSCATCPMRGKCASTAN